MTTSTWSRSLDQEIRGEIQALAAEEAERQAEVNAAEAAVPHLEDWDSAPESARRDAVRATIRWMAVVPIDSPRVPDQWGRLVPGAVVGKILVCTVWNSLVTAIVVREWCEDSAKRRLIGLRLAEMEECCASVMDLPDVESFKAGLTRSYAGKKIGYDPVRHLPGYEAGVAPPASVLHPILGAAALIVTPNGTFYPDRESYLRALAAESATVLARRPAAHIVVPLVGERAQAPHFFHPSADLPSRAAGLLSAARADGAIHITTEPSGGGTLRTVVASLLPERLVAIGLGLVAVSPLLEPSPAVQSLLAVLGERFQEPGAPSLSASEGTPGGSTAGVASGG